MTAFPFPVSQRTLGNGLRLYVVGFDSPGLVAYYSVVRTGSRNEVEAGKSGFAHFFEHMMFRGTERRSQEAYNDEIKRMGADSNAFTSNDLTVYHILAGKDALPTIVDLESDRFRNLSYREPEFQKEARAVLGEYNKGASNPLQKLFEALVENAFSRHTYQHTTMGFLKDIEVMPDQFDYSRQFFDRYYRPDNVVLLVVGDTTLDQVLPLVERHYGDWGPGPERPSIPVEPPQEREKRVALDWNGPTLPLLLEGWHTPAFSTDNPDLQALDVLAELLFSERAPLFKRLVIEQQRVDSISGSNDLHVDPNLFTVLARLKRPEHLPDVEQAIDAEVARIGREGVDQQTLQEVKSNIRYAFAHALTTADRTAGIAAQFIALSGELEAVNAYYAGYQRVSSEDVQRVAQTYFQPSNRTLVTLTGKAA
jgi:zinc protease